MYRLLAKHLLYPLGELIQGTKLLTHLRNLEETQWWSMEQLRQLQDEKLRALIKHAYYNVPYYGRVFQERGLTEKDVQSVEDLQKLPVLTKKIIKANFNDLIPKDIKHRRKILNSTSGYSGELLTYYLDMDSLSMSWACTFRAWEWAGYEPGDKRATLAGSALVPDSPPTLKQRLRDLAERNLKLSAFNMNEHTMGLYANKLERYQPRFLRGYPLALYTFARYLETAGINTIKPKAVMTTAEVLLPQHREVIERQFGCKVFDNYGCNDGGANACECDEHKGYHISVERAFMEFSKPTDSYGGREIILTDFHNYSMPFIRYLVGDMGIPEDDQCPCGRGLPRIKALQGRVSDFIVTPEGTKIHGEFFSHIFWEMTSFERFQVVQDYSNSLVIKVIPHPLADASTLEKETKKIIEIISMRTGVMEIRTEKVDKIPTTKAGKYRFIISNVPK